MKPAEFDRHAAAYDGGLDNPIKRMMGDSADQFIAVKARWLLRRAPDEQRIVLAHEAEHVRARDPLLLAAGCAGVALLPWHPVSWWLLARLRLAVELDCDRRVLRRGVAPRVLEKILGGNVLRVLDAVPAWGAMAAPASHSIG